MLIKRFTAGSIKCEVGRHEGDPCLLISRPISSNKGWRVTLGNAHVYYPKNDEEKRNAVTLGTIAALALELIQESDLVDGLNGKIMYPGNLESVKSVYQLLFYIQEQLDTLIHSLPPDLEIKDDKVIGEARVRFGDGRVSTSEIKLSDLDND